MKKILILAFSLTISILAISCSDENSAIVNQEANGKTVAKLTKGSLPTNGIIFTYATDDEFVTVAADKLSQWSINSNSEIQESEGDFTRIVDKIAIEKGVGLLSERYYLDDIKKSIVLAYQLNPDTGQYINITPTSTSPNPILDNLLNCPSGYTYMGSCDFGPDFGTCVSNTVQGHQSNVLSNGTMDTSQYQFNYTSSGASICSKSKST